MQALNDKHALYAFVVITEMYVSLVTTKHEQKATWNSKTRK